jgi:hypothetical protein
MNNHQNMKRIKPLEEFGKDFLQEAITPEKAKFRFSITANIKKVSKINKTMIDIHQLLIEMSDEIVALKLSYDNLDAESMRVINNMKTNIDNLIGALKKKKEDGSYTGMIDNSARLERNLERLKTGFLKMKGV